MLDALLNDLREKTLSEALSRSIGDEIGVRDVVEAFGRQVRDQPVYNSRRYRSVERLLQFYAVTAGILGIVSAVLFVVIDTTGESKTPIPVAAALGSFSIAVTSTILLLWFRTRQRRDENIAAESHRQASKTALFLDQWIQIETFLRLTAADLFGQSVAERSLSSIIEQMTKNDLITSADLDEVYQLLRFRNSLVHGETSEDDVLTKRIYQASNLLDRLV